jgi:DNA mismatch repair protein MutL
MADFFKKHRPGQTQRQFEHKAAGERREAAPRVSEKGYETPRPQTEYLQIHNSFIVAQTEDGFVIVDQHALHERIIYENLSRRIQKTRLESQRLLIPESFELTDAQADALKTNAELIVKLGIELVPFGPKTIAIQAFPTLLSKAAPLDFIRDLLDLLTDRSLSLDAERLLDEVLNMAACKAAIKAGQRLSNSEIEQLLADKARVEYGSRCPHGRPTTIRFSLNDLERQFKRT